MIIDKHIYCINQPGLFKPCDYMLCQYTPSAYAEVNAKYSGIFVKYYGDGKFEFLNNIIIKKDVTLNGSPVILCDFGVHDSDQPIGMSNYQDFLVVGRPATGSNPKILKLRFQHEDMEDGRHTQLLLTGLYDFDSNFNMKFYSYVKNKGYVFSEKIYCELSGMLFTTNMARFHTYLTLGYDDDNC